MDERCCLEWVEKVIKPWAESALPGIVPILLLDQYKCHLMDSVVSKIQSYGIELDHIPGGCTGLVQPVDVGINKPLKNLIHGHWEQWMMDVGIKVAKTKKPPCETMVEWIAFSVSGLSVDTIWNSWH